MSKSIVSETKRGLLYSYITIIVKNILQVLSIGIASRLLDPVDFGIMSIIGVFNGFVQMFSELGLTASIIQRKELTHSEISSANIFSIGMGISFTILIFLLSPLLENLFNTQGLAYYMKICSFVFIIKSVSIVHEALLRKEMKFKNLFYSDLTAFVIGNLGVYLIMAYLGFGVMSFVFNILTQAFINAIMNIYFSSFKVAFIYKWKEVKKLLNFGVPFTLGQFSMYIANQGDFVIIGKFMGPAALGFYSRSFQLMRTPVEFLGGTLSRVLFPAFSRIKDNKQALKKIFLNTVFISAVFCLPFSCLLFLEAENVIRIILGEKWGDSVLPFRILVLTLFFRVGYKFVDVIINVTGRPGLKAKFQFLYCVLIIAGAYAGTKVGLNLVTTLVSIAVVIHYLIMNFIVFGELSIRVKELVPEIKHAVLVSMAFVVLLSLFKRIVHINNPYIELSISCLLLLLVYGLAVITFRDVVEKRILWLFKKSGNPAKSEETVEQ